MFCAHRTAAASPGGGFAQTLAAAITKLGTVQLYRSQHGHVRTLHVSTRPLPKPGSTDEVVGVSAS